MLNSRLYAIWQKHLKQSIPDTCRTRLTNLMLLIVGIYQAQSIHLSIIARKIPIAVQKLSLERRLRRFLANDAVDVRSWYHPWASWLVQSAAVSQQINLIIDTSKVTSRKQLICVALAYRRRALPIAWDWIPHRKGRSTIRFQIQLLTFVHTLLPSGCCITLVGDAEFGDPALIEQLQDWGWDYALRQSKNVQVMLNHADDWQRVENLPLKMGEMLYFRKVILTETSRIFTHVALFWAQGEKRPWYLATNQTSALRAIQLYKRRMWIEEMFADFKKHGFNLEVSRLHHSQRLSRLMLAVAILYLWLIALGEYVIRQQLSAAIDRSNRFDLSIFRLGWDWLERQLVLRRYLPDILHPNLCLLPYYDFPCGHSKDRMIPFGVR